MKKGIEGRKSRRQQEELEWAKEQIKELIEFKVSGSTCHVNFRPVLSQKSTLFSQSERPDLVELLTHVSVQVLKDREYEIVKGEHVMGTIPSRSLRAQYEVVGLLLTVKNRRLVPLSPANLKL